MQSVLWSRRAAEAGSIDAQVALATAYYLGRGAPKDAALRRTLVPRRGPGRRHRRDVSPRLALRAWRGRDRSTCA